VCSALVNEVQDFFCPYLVIWLHKKLLRSGWSCPCIGICCVFGGKFLHFSAVCCTCQSQVEVISLCHQHYSLAEEWPSAFILFHHGKNHLCLSMSYWAGDYRRVQLHQHVCPLVGIHQLLLAFASLFQSITVLGFTMALSSDIVLYTRLCLLKTVKRATWSPKTVDT